MNIIYSLLFGIAFGLAASASYINLKQERRIDAADREIAALKAELAAHREDAKTAVGKIFDDIGKVRFTQAALVNSIRFANGSK